MQFAKSAPSERFPDQDDTRVSVGVGQLKIVKQLKKFISNLHGSSANSLSQLHGDFRWDEPLVSTFAVFCRHEIHDECAGLSKGFLKEN